jgi:antitoxin component YwqK of YwqJK toxin-antitoxin module
MFLFACSESSPCPDQTELMGEMPPTSEAELAKAKYKNFEASCVVQGAHGKLRHGFLKTWYRGGRVLKSQYTYEGGVKNGDYSLFYPDGQLRETGKFRFGIKHGRWISYHRNGKIHMEGEYQDGKKSGDFIVTSDSGTHIQKGPYFLDMKHGMWRS